MKVKKIVDVYGRELEIDEDTRKVIDFSNKNRKVTYNAQIVEENSDGSKFWADYIEEGVVDDIETKVGIWNSKLELIYAKIVRFKANSNDPNGVKFKAFCDYIKNNQDKFFDKYGDYRKDFLFSDDEIKSIFGAE